MEKPLGQNKDDWDWKGYYDEIAGEKHSRSLEKAIGYCAEKGNALDIGAGNLRDTNYLLKQGFSVTAVDTAPASKEIAQKIDGVHFQFVQDSIGKFEFKENYFSVINAQSILFHFQPKIFAFIMEGIKKSLKQGGVFCGDFLGKNDDWNIPAIDKTFLNKEEIEKLFEGFEIKMFKETEYEGNFADSVVNKTNKTKHWDWIMVIAVKR